MSDERFERLFAAHADSVRRYIARRHVGDDVDDLTADVFTIAWEKLATIPSDYELPWLYRTAWNVVANEHRRVRPIAMDVPPDDVEPDLADDVIDDMQLKACWTALSGRDREVLRLAAWEGLNGRELASVLGMSEGGASAALSRARARLHDLWVGDETAVGS